MEKRISIGLILDLVIYILTRDMYRTIRTVHGTKEH